MIFPVRMYKGNLQRISLETGTFASPILDINVFDYLKFLARY